jgi:hypothetical protein
VTATNSGSTGTRHIERDRLSTDAIPHDHEAEAAVIGSMILEGQVIDQVRHIVSVRSFDREPHRVIYSELLNLWGKTHSIDLTQLKSALSAKGLLGDVGGIDCLVELASSVPNAASAKHYADIVKDIHGRRQLIRTGEAIAASGYDSTATAAEQIADASMKMDAIRAEYEAGTASPLQSRCMADIERKEVTMLWAGRFPLGELSIIAGSPGLGKSMVSLDMAARITTGRPWSDALDDTSQPVGRVLLLSVEDDLGSVVRPRLEAAGADLSKIITIDGFTHPSTGILTPFAASTDLHYLEDMIADLGDCRLVIVDPLSQFLGGNVDAHRENEVRAALTPLATMAHRHQVAVLGVMHLSKSKAQAALDRVLGSVAFSAVARAVWMLTKDPDDRESRLLLCGKMNLCKPADTLSFEIEHPGRIKWHDGTVDADADDLLTQLPQFGCG